jgi:uroporphyrinogen decarboxylase
MNSRERFLSACACEPHDRPPLWVMRQAGRYLPEYRELKAKSSFLEMVRTPALATEVTLQPLRRFPGIDAAILFSDILVIPEALGQPYAFRETGGIAMHFALSSRALVEQLAPAHAVPERLQYVADTLRLLKQELGGQRALLGFGGSPWTHPTVTRLALAHHPEAHVSRSHDICRMPLGAHERGLNAVPSGEAGRYGPSIRS